MASVLPPTSCPNVQCDASVVTMIPGPPGAKGDTGATPSVTLASITPQTTAGDLIGYTTTPVRHAIGTEGQTLVARLANANKLAWESFATALGLTTKGDILVRNATTVTRLAVGANNTVLTADSTVAEGVKWGSATSSSTMPPVTVVTTTPYTATASDEVLLINMAVASAVSIFLPNSAAYKRYVIKDLKGDAGTNNITITPFAGQTIDGAATLVLNVNNASVVIRYYLPSTRWMDINV